MIAVIIFPITKRNSLLGNIFAARKFDCSQKSSTSKHLYFTDFVISSKLSPPLDVVLSVLTNCWPWSEL